MNKLDIYVQKYKLNTLFDHVPQFRLKEFEKGDIIASPLKPLNDFYFIVEGSIHIYSIFQDGASSTITIHDGFALLGDVEFIQRIQTQDYVEALNHVCAICVEMDEELRKDVPFLNFLLSFVLNKFTNVTDEHISIEEKLLHYMKYECADQTISHVSNTALILHISRRQLQRVLVDLIQKEKIVKIKKGTYQLK